MVEDAGGPDLTGKTSNQVNRPLRAAWHTGRTAIVQNRVPTCILWLFGVILIFGYFQWPALASWLDRMGEFRWRHGFAFSFLSTALFGGLIPALIPGLIGRREPPINLRNVASATLFWGLKGWEIDLFYRWQAYWLGTAGDFGTIVGKTMVDQFIYVPLIGVVNIVLFYLWRDNGFSFKRTWFALGPHWYQRRVLPLLISNWVVWIPAVALIYALPLALQLPIQNLVLCFWVLILVVFTAPEPSPNRAGTAPADNG
ncbi:MAG: Mpv17/PMP22 family protein [Mariniblastus sp.]|nr:Mpv17/PMP22 family protein [Mariniblastus sp.]